MSPKLKALERRFYSDGYRLAIHSLKDGYSPEALKTAIKELHRMIDELIDSFTGYAVSEHHTPDCKKGCSWCCWQPVYALSYELDYLKEYLRDTFKDEVMAQIEMRATAKAEKLNEMEEEVMLNSKFPCPLLSDGSCMAYSARPVACRIYLSTDVNTCRKFHKYPSDPDSVPALMNFPLRTGRILNEGFRAGLNAAGITSHEMRIEEGLE